jgi:hypothetical protein
VFDCCGEHVQLQLTLHTIKEGITFCGCDSLTHVRLPSTVTKIESEAFAQCPRLISLELPEGLEIIDLQVRDDHDEEGEPEFRNYGCPALMNLVIPSEQHFQQLDVDGDEFMEGFNLGTAASNFDDLVRKLQHRFDALPLHGLCYYVSLFQALMKVHKVDIICTRDKFGSTPMDYLFLNHTYEATTAIQSLLPTIDSCRSSPLAWSGSMAVRGHLDCNE